MYLLTNIINWIKNAKITKTDILYIGLIIFILISIYQCDSNTKLNEEIASTQVIANRNFNNLKASQDTIKFERNKNGELIAIKLSYEFDINELTSENKKIIEKYRKSLDINKELNGVNSLLRAEIKVKDSIINASSSVTITSDSTVTISVNDEKKWDKYNWRRFNGTVDVLRDKKTNNIEVLSNHFNIEQGIELKAAIITDHGINRLKITSPSPGVIFTNIENINLINSKLNKKNEKKSGWSVGAGIGYGINLNSNQGISIGPSINVGLIWSPEWLRF